MKKILLGSLMTAVTLFGATMSWQKRIGVTRSVPVYRTVTIRTPYQVCRNRCVRVCPDGAVPAAAVLGAVGGGVLGHQIGNGHGKEAATIGGAVIGALVGSQMVLQNGRSACLRRRVCTTHYTRRTERRLVRYKNIAWYRGRKIVKYSRRPLRYLYVTVTAAY